MTDILLNSQKINLSFSPHTKLKDLVADLSTNYLQGSDTITNIFLNERPIENAKESFSFEISHFNAINFEVRNIYQLAFETLITLGEHLLFTINKIERTAPLIRKGKSEDATSSFFQLIDFIDLFIKSTQDILSSLKEIIPEELKAKIQVTETMTLSLFQKILQAQEKNNTIWLADLLEYELIPCLNVWQKEIIPLLKSLEETMKHDP